MNWKAAPLAFLSAISIQTASLAQLHITVVPTSCGKDAHATYVSVKGTSQVLLTVTGIGSNAAAAIEGLAAHQITSLSFDTSVDDFGLLGADPNLEVVALVVDPRGSIHQGYHNYSLVTLNANNAHHTKLSNGYTRCTFSSQQLSDFTDVATIWINCAGPNFTEFPPGTNSIFVTNFVINNRTIKNFDLIDDNSACGLPTAT